MRLCLFPPQLDVFEAAELYQKEGTPLIILAGKKYGSGSSRDWAAKGPYLLVPSLQYYPLTFRVSCSPQRPVKGHLAHVGFWLVLISQGAWSVQDLM